MSKCQISFQGFNEKSGPSLDRLLVGTNRIYHTIVVHITMEKSRITSCNCSALHSPLYKEDIGKGELSITIHITVGQFQ